MGSATEKSFIKDYVLALFIPVVTYCLMAAVDPFDIKAENSALSRDGFDRIMRSWVPSDAILDWADRETTRRRYQEILAEEGFVPPLTPIHVINFGVAETY